MTYPTRTLADVAERDEQAAEQALRTLKSLLMEDEQKQLVEIQERLDDPLMHADEVALVLPQALRRTKETDLAKALERPLTQSVLRAVRHQPKAFAEAVFPILGPAIRRAIAEALRGMVRKLNRVLDHSFSPRGLRWRLEAWRSGMSFSEVVLRHTLEYRVEQAFLIRSADGVMLSHVSDELNLKQDPDAYSAMLTAIQSFYKDTIDADESISAVDLVEHTALLVHGPIAYIACVIAGEPPMELRGELADNLAEIHARYSDNLQAFSGDRRDAAILEPELRRCLLAKETPASETRGRSLKAFLAVLGLIIAATGWVSYTQWQEHRLRQAELARQSRAVALLRTVPGIVMTDVKQAPGRLQIHGLRDPLAKDPEQVLRQSGLEIAGWQAHWRPFQAAEPEIALHRARLRLQPPDDVTLELHADRQLVAKGLADQAWISRAALLAPTVPGVEALDTSGLVSADTRLLREAARPLTPGLVTVDSHDLAAAEHRRLADLRSAIEATSIRFEAGSFELTEIHRETLERLAGQLDELLPLARLLKMDASVRIVGRTDGTGSPANNELIALQRALKVGDGLTELGIPRTTIEPVAHPLLRSDGRARPDLRRVEIEIKLDPPPGDR